MCESLALYMRYVGVSLRAQMQYRVSFVLQVLAQLGVTSIEFFTIAVLFARFGALEGWSLPRVAILYGLVHVSFALAEALGRGFDVFPELVRGGGFDRILLRPRGAAFQVLAAEFQVMRIGRLAQGLAVLVWGLAAQEHAWACSDAVLIAWAILGGVCFFGALMIFSATLAFWTVEGLELMNVLTYGGVETAQFPLDIYRPWFRAVFTFGVPLACVNYLPAQALFGAATPESVLAGWLAPLACAAFLGVSLLAWRAGVRRYVSTGS